MKRIILLAVVLASVVELWAQDFTMELKGSPPGGLVMDIEVSPSTSALFIIVQNSGVYKSTDNAVTWTKVLDQSLVDLDIDASGIVYGVNTGGNIYQSTDNAGTSYTSKNGMSGALASQRQGLLLKKGAGQVMYGVSNYQNSKQAVYRSADNGTSWTEVFAETNVNNQVGGILVNAAGNVFLYSRNNGIYKSGTGISGYTLSNTGITNPSSTTNNSSQSKSGMAYAGGSEMLAIFSNAIYKSTDNGSNWTSATPPGYTSFVGANIYGSSSGNSAYVINPSSNVIHVYNGGTWTSTASTLQTGGINRIVAKASNDLYLATDHGVLKSSTGTAWTIANDGLQGQYYNGGVSSLNFFTFNDVIYTMSRPMTKSTDGGTTWTTHGAIGSNNFFVLPAPDGTLMSPNFSDVRVSTDVGASWSSRTPLITAQYMATDGTNVYSINSTGQIARTANAGVSWTQLTLTGQPTSSVSGIQNVTIANGFLYYSSFNAQQRYYKVNLTTNAVSEIPPPAAATISQLQPNSLWVYNDKLILATATSTLGGVTQVYTSTNGGTNWTAATIPSLSSPYFFMTNYGYFVMLSIANSVVMMSRDNGQSWITTTVFGLITTPRGAALDATGHLQILADYRGLYRSTTPLALPLPPTNLKVTGSTFNSVRLEWDNNSDNETSFVLERSIGNNSNFAPFATLTFSNQALKAGTFIQTVNPSTTYFYRIAAVNNAGTSAYSNEISFTSPAKCVSAIPDNRLWNVTTAGTGGQPVRTGAASLVLSRLDDFQYGGAAFWGTSPAWTNPYTTVNGSISATLVENCGSVYMSMAGTHFLAPDGNGTYDANTKTITLKWKLNEAVTPPTTPPISETSVLTMQATYPAPSSSSVPTPIPGVYDNTGIGVSWLNQATYGTELGIERATSAAGPFTEVGRQSHPEYFFVDRSNLVDGTTYYYRLKAYNPDQPAGVAGLVSASVLFTKPYFAGVETQTGYPISTRVSTAWTDVNNDGYDDLFFSASITQNEPSTILMNQKDGTFVKKVFLNSLSTYFSASKFADLNNDGNVDGLVYNTETALLEIHSGDGTGNFTKVWTSPSRTFPSNLEDVDNDGKLDVIVYTTDPANTSMLTLYILKNNGNFNFTRGADILANEQFFFSGTQIVDYDNDGDRDIYMYGSTSNNAEPWFRMLANNGDGTYGVVTIPTLQPATNAGGIPSGVEWVDIDNDSDFDLHVHYQIGKGLFRNNGDGTFTPITTGAIVTEGNGSGFSSTWADIENDGDMDMICSGNTVATPTGIYINDGQGGFTRKLGESVAHWHYGRNIYVNGDYNRDGSIDLSVGSNDNRGRIFKGNNFNPNNKWLNVKLRGVKSNQSAMGATIKAVGATITQIKKVGIHYANSGGHNSLTKHFGLGPDTQVNLVVTWPSGKTQTINGVAANQNLEIVEDTDGPVLASTTPANAAVDVANNTTISMTFDENFTVAAGKFIDILNAANLSTPLFHIGASTGTVVGKTITYTLPGRLPSAADITVAIDAGAFVDQYGTGNLAVAANTWKFKTLGGPTYSTISPAKDATNVSLATPFEINFNSAVTIVTGKKLIVKDGATPVANIDVINGTVTGTKFSISLPGTLPPSKLMEVTVEPGAFQDAANGNDFAGIAAGVWTFTTAATLDQTKPEITFAPATYQQLDRNFSTQQMTLSATDASGVANVTFYSRKSSETNFSPISATKGSGDQWLIPISGSIQDDMGFEYYIEAKDNAIPANIGRSPQTGTHRSKTKITAANQTIGVPAGGTKQSWRIISIPFDLPNDDRQISSIFTSLGDAGRSTWRLLHYSNTPSETWLEYPGFTNIERGKGYFINSIEGGSVTLNANATTPDFSRSNLFSRDLVKGWNQIGNPYPVPINWDNIKTYNNNPDIGQLVLFSNGSYSAGATIPPGQGGFVFMNNPANVKFSFSGQTLSSGRPSGTQNGPIDSKNWLVDLKLTAGDLNSDLSGFGMNEYADASYDKHDGVNAPRFFDFLEVNFPHPEHFMKKFARDVIPTSDEHVWEFNVQSSNGEMTVLSWDNSGFGEGDKELYLYDVDAQMPVNMRTGTSYSFGTPAGRRFKIYFGKDVISEIKPERALLGAAFPNPTSGFATIPFSLPENNGTLAVRLEVFDMLGRKVATLLQSDMKSGFYNTDWVPEEANSNGFYIYRLTVGNGAGEILSGKILLRR